MSFAPSVTFDPFPSLPPMATPSGKAVGMYSKEHRKVSGEASKALGERVADFLRLRHPAKTAANVAADAGLPSGTVAKWLEGAATPSLYAGLKLADAYGPDFVAAVWPNGLGFLADAARAEQARRLRAQIADLQAKLEQVE